MKPIFKPKQPPKEIPCVECDGTKINPEKPEEQCPTCLGKGVLTVVSK